MSAVTTPLGHIVAAWQRTVELWHWNIGLCPRESKLQILRTRMERSSMLEIV